MKNENNISSKIANELPHQYLMWINFKDYFFSAPYRCNVHNKRSNDTLYSPIWAEYQPFCVPFV